MPTNELELARTFREAAGLTQDQAEIVATAIFDAIRSNVATKADLHATPTDIRADLQATAADIRAELQDIRADTHEIRKDLQITTDHLRAEMKAMEHRLLWAGAAASISGVGILFAALHAFPPHA